MRREFGAKIRVKFEVLGIGDWGQNVVRALL